MIAVLEKKVKRLQIRLIICFCGLVVLGVGLVVTVHQLHKLSGYVNDIAVLLKLMALP